MFNRKIFGERLRMLRRYRRVSQTVVAEQLGVTKTQISDLENGKTTTSMEKLVTLSEYFDVTTDFILGISDQSK